MYRKLATITLAAALSLTATPAVAYSPKMPPCVYEDGSGGPLPCYWDATTMGNRVGLSFWVDRHEKLHYGSLTHAHRAADPPVKENRDD